MHFTYSELKSDELMQGDVLNRTAALDDLLRDVHPHFFSHSKNLHFIVLTQSCDLVRRNGGCCKAPYVSIAPVRSLDLVIERWIQQQSAASVVSELPVIGVKAKTKATEFLQRLMNNNEPGFFYLESSGTALEQDSVAYLNLSIAIKSDLHFDTCLKAKAIQLAEPFQAKLGWLVGQMYSRVGTTDWPAKELNSKAGKLLKDVAIWIEDGMIKDVEAEFARIKEDTGAKSMSAKEISRFISRSPSKKDKVMAEAEKIVRGLLGDGSQVDLLLARLKSDAALTKLLG